MAFEMDQVLSKLFIGNIVNSMDMRHLTKYNISHIISINENARVRYPDREYLLIKAFDKQTEDLSKYFSQSNDFIHAARLNSSGVLVHCIKGASRSATVVLAYLMSVTELGLQDALHFLKRKRPSVNPNKGFLKQLGEFEKHGLIEERERLKAHFSNDKDLRTSDQRELFCIEVMKKYAR